MKYLLNDLINKSIFIIREAKNKFNNPAVLWSTGKDSTTMLSLINEALYEIPFPVIHIDTGFKFKEIYQFRDKIDKEWKLNLVICENKEAKNKGMNSTEYSKLECCTTLKTEALKQLLAREHYDALIVSIRRDEHGIRSMERFMSPRDKDFKWKLVRKKKEDEEGDAPYVSLQDTEMSGWFIFATDFGKECNHVRVHPLLHWDEIDVWKYIKLKNLPVNPLYFKGYRSLGCSPCTNPIWSPPSSVDEIIHRLETTKIPEREGRDQDKEDLYIMQRLRILGYL